MDEETHHSTITGSILSLFREPNMFWRRFVVVVVVVVIAKYLRFFLTLQLLLGNRIGCIQQENGRDNRLGVQSSVEKRQCRNGNCASQALWIYSFINFGFD